MKGKLLHRNLLYELIKHVKRNSCLCHFDGKDIYGAIYIIVDYRVGIFSLLISVVIISVGGGGSWGGQPPQFGQK